MVSEKQNIKIKKKKFNEENFKKELEFFKQCEIRKKEKIQKLQEEKLKKEISLINNKKNIHYHKILPKKQLPSFLERIYTKDLEKRKEKQQILTKIYTPTFTPSLYAKRNSNNFKKKNSIKTQNNNIENIVEENLTYNNENQKTYNDIFSEQSQKSYKIKGKIKYNKEKKEQNEIIMDKNENENENEENEEEDDIIQKRVVVENALRNKLFNRGKKQKRNKSAELRNKK